MSRVCHIVTALGVGGAEHQLERMVAGTRDDHHVISLRSRGTVGPELEAAGASVTALELGNIFGLGLGAMRIRRYLARLKPDVVQGWMYHGNIAAVVGAWGRGIPVFWNVRHSVQQIGSELDRTRRAIQASVYLSGYPDVIVYNSEAAAAQHEHLGYPAHARRVIPNGFDTRMFKRSVEDRSELRRDLGIPDGGKVVGMIARYHPTKNHSGFLRVAGRIAQEHPDAYFILAGGGVDTENSHLATAVDLPQLRGRVHLLGKRKDMIRIYSALDLLCCPSWGEAFPNAVGEAMSCEVPCVVTDVGDSAVVVGSTGIAVPPGDENAITEAIALLLRDGHRRKGLGVAARNRIKSAYDVSIAADAYTRLWNKGL